MTNSVNGACLKEFHEESVYCKVQRWSIWLQKKTGFEPIKQHRNTLAIHYLQRDLFRGYPSDFPKYWIGGPIERFLCLVILSSEHLNTRERTIYTPSYLNSSTHIILSPEHCCCTSAQKLFFVGYCSFVRLFVGTKDPQRPAAYRLFGWHCHLSAKRRKNYRWLFVKSLE